MKIFQNQLNVFSSEISDSIPSLCKIANRITNLHFCPFFNDSVFIVKLKSISQSINLYHHEQKRCNYKVGISLKNLTFQKQKSRNIFGRVRVISCSTFHMCLKFAGL